MTFSGSGSNSTTKTIIDINISCVTNPTLTDIDSYIALNSGDVIVKDTVDA